MEVVVHDASTMINLLKSDLLRSAATALGLHILTTDLVAAEVREPRKEFDRAVTAGQVEIRGSGPEDLVAIVAEQRLARGLSLPDVSVVALARTAGCPLFSSDGPVRAYAIGQEIEVRGELWILDELVTGGHMTCVDATEALARMIEQKARLPKTEVEKRMMAWQKEFSHEGAKSAKKNVGR